MCNEYVCSMCFRNKVCQFYKNIGKSPSNPMIKPTRFRLSITIRSVSNDLLLKSLLEKLPLRSLNTKKKAIGIPAQHPNF